MKLSLTRLAHLSVFAGLVTSAVGCTADLSAAASIELGHAHAASALSDEASRSLPAVTSFSVLGYEVSKSFHRDGTIHLTLLPQEASGSAILDKNLYVEIDATCNVPFPMKAEVGVGAIRSPLPQKPFKFGIELDGSGSMESSDPDKLRIKATQDVVDTVDQSFPGSVFSVQQFDTKVTVLSPFTPDIAVTKAAVAKASAEGGTALHKSTAQLIDAMAAIPDDGHQPAVLVLSDGMDNSSEGVTSEQVIAKANAAHIPIYAVGLGGALDVPGLSFVGDLQSYAAGTGGVFTYVKNAGDLNSRLQKLATGAAKGQILAEVKIVGGVFVPFSTITIRVDVHSGSKVMSDSFDFIVPID